MEINLEGGFAAAGHINTVVFEDQKFAVQTMWTGAGNMSAAFNIKDVDEIDADHPNAAEVSEGAISPPYANPFKGWYGRDSVKLGAEGLDLP